MEEESSSTLGQMLDGPPLLLICNYLAEEGPFHYTGIDSFKDYRTFQIYSLLCLWSDIRCACYWGVYLMFRRCSQVRGGEQQAYCCASW